MWYDPYEWVLLYVEKCGVNAWSGIGRVDVTLHKPLLSGVIFNIFFSMIFKFDDYESYSPWDEAADAPPCVYKLNSEACCLEPVKSVQDHSHLQIH